MAASKRSMPRLAESGGGGGGGGESTPICRCRVLYLGSAVPHVTKDGLHGIQEPLRELYPEQGAMGAKGIDSWLSVWSNGLLLENVDENHKRVTRFFAIDSLHYCAAVRYVLVPTTSSGERMARFLPLDSPFARQPNIAHPPLFACIMRRTTGIKVLECHVFICKRETAANALVRCCFHAYADSTYAHHLENGGAPLQANGCLSKVSAAPAGSTIGAPGDHTAPETDLTLNSIEKVEGWRLQQQQQQQQGGGPLTNGVKNDDSGVMAIGNGGGGSGGSSNGMGSASVSMLILDNGSADEEGSLLNGDSNHKVWAPAEAVYAEYGSNTMRSVSRSTLALAPSAVAAPVRRPRQISATLPAPPPPPPPPPISETGTSRHKSKDKKPAKSIRDDEVASQAASRRSSSVFNFPISRHHPPPPGATLHPHPPLPYPPFYQTTSRRPPPPMHHLPPAGYFPPQAAMPGPMPPPGAILVPVPVNAKKLKNSLKFGTFSARGKKSKNNQQPQHPVMFLPPNNPYATLPNPMAPPPMALGIPMGMAMPPMTMRRPSSRMSQEEPIYMPAAVRPISPIASYQPAHFPHEAYLLQQQYTTSQRSSKEKPITHTL